MNESRSSKSIDAKREISGDHSGLPTYFDISGLYDDVSDYENGKLWLKAVKVLEESPTLLSKGKVTEQYFIHDRQIEKHLQFSEQISNFLYFTWLRDAPELLADAIENSTHHGQSHRRRLEKWYKKAQGEDKALRSNVHFLYFSLSAFISGPFHDIPEVWCDEKDGHDGSGALLALGSTLQAQDVANESVGHYTNGDHHSFPPKDFEKIAWGAAFICFYHSYPDRLPATEQLMQQGILNPERLLEAAEVLKNSVNNKRLGEGKEPFSSVEQVFPAFRLIDSTIQKIRNGSLRVPVFSETDIEGLKQQTRLFAAADKLDSNFPPDLSAVRTFLTQPKRAFYKRLEKGEKEMSLDDELTQRIERCMGHAAPCDFDRFLYEITRTKTFDDVSPTINYWYAYALRGKARFLTRAIGLLINGDGSSFVHAYDHLEKDMTEAALVKAEYEETEAMRIAEDIQITGDYKRMKMLLRSKGYTSDTFLQMLLQIQKERRHVEGIVADKIQTIRDEQPSEDEKARIVALLKRARELQDTGLGYIPGPILNTDHDIVPYKGYLPIRVTKISAKTSQ